MAKRKTDSSVSAAAKTLGRKGASKGGKARARSLDSAERIRIATEGGKERQKQKRGAPPKKRT